MRKLVIIYIALFLSLLASQSFAVCTDKLIDPIWAMTQLDYRTSEGTVSFYKSLKDLTSVMNVPPVSVLNLENRQVYDGVEKDLVLFDLQQSHIDKIKKEGLVYADLEMGRNFELDWSPLLYNRVEKMGMREVFTFDEQLFNEGTVTPTQFENLSQSNMAHMHIQYRLVALARNDGLHFVNGGSQRFVRIDELDEFSSNLDPKSRISKILKHKVNPKIARIFIDDIQGSFAVVREVVAQGRGIGYIKRLIRVDPNLAKYLKEKDISVLGGQVLLYPEVVGLSRIKLNSGNAVRTDLLFNSRALPR